MPVMDTVIVVEPPTPALAIGNDISDDNSDAVLVVGEGVIAELAMLAFAPPVEGVNTPWGNDILIESALVKSCEILIVIVRAPPVHTAELPWEERVPPEDAHRPLPASHVVPTSQHPGP
jgi:hypothetical protein